MHRRFPANQQEVTMSNTSVKDWVNQVIKEDEIDRYLDGGKDFIDEERIQRQLEEGRKPEKERIRAIIRKSLSIQRLEPEETAALLHVEDPELWEEMGEAAGMIKRSVYDNRIVTFAPLYCANLCVNNCVYCGFRAGNPEEKRRVLTMDEVQAETRSLVGTGHKRLIAVYGEHPSSDADYIADSIRNIYAVRDSSCPGKGEIRRVNVNAAPMSIDDLKKLHEVGIGTFQVFQETYHRQTYGKMHPGTVKGNYRWRLYALHRAMEAGVDDVAIGALFGLYDWKFEVMGLLYHAIELEKRFNGIGPHTVSFPRLNPAGGSDTPETSPYLVSDEDLKKIIIVLRLSIPYTGMILTAREKPELRHELIPYGITQIDASSRIGIGAYSECDDEQATEKQQFLLGDTRSLDAVIREYAEMGMITSFCTAGYRCGRTGDKIMNLLRCGTEGKFCKLNAVLTFREWLDDYASPETKAAGEAILKKEMDEIRKDEDIRKMNLIPQFESCYRRICDGERDIYL